MATRAEFEDLMRQRIREGDYEKANRIRTEKLGLPPLPAPQITQSTEFQDTPLQEAGNVLSGIPQNLLTGLGEMGSATGQAVAQGLDFLGPGTANAALRLAGSDYQLPTFEGGYEGLSELVGSQPGGFMPPGMPRDVIRGFGGALPGAAGNLPVAGRNVATPAGAAAELLGLGAAKAQPGVAPLAFGGGPPALSPPSMQFPSSRAAGELIQADPGNVGRAGLAVDPYTGRTIADEGAQAALKQELDPGFVAMIQSATDSTREKMRKMVDAIKRGRAHYEERSLRRPLDVAGESMVDRVDVVKEINSRSGKELDGVADALKDQPIDVTGPIGNFVENVRGMGVDFGVEEGIQLGFTGSDIEGLKGPINTLQDMVKRLSQTRTPDAYDVHRVKRYIDELVTYGKSKKGLGGRTERIIKQLRSDLDGLLDSNFPEYDRVNTQYSETVRALDGLQELVGKKNDLFGDQSDRIVGTLLRRIESNAQSGPRVIKSMEDMDALAKKYASGGGTEVGPVRGALTTGVEPRAFDDSVRQQVLFADQLNRLFGTPAGTSFQGEIAKAVEKGAEDTLRGRTVADLALDTGKWAYHKARGINEERALQALIDLLGE